MTTLTLHIEDMHCSACTNKISNALAGISDIAELRFNPVRKQVLISHHAELDSKKTIATIIATIEDAGFHPALTQQAPSDAQADQKLLLRLGIAGLALMQVMMAQGALYAGMFQGMDQNVQYLLEYTALIFCIPVVSFSAMPFFRRGFTKLTGGVNMDTPIALAITIAFLTSLVATLTGQGETYYDSVAMFTFLMLGARYFDSRLRSRVAFDRGLLTALPTRVTRIDKSGARDGHQADHTTINLVELKPGDALWIKEGDQIPADGVLLDQTCTIDEALLSGESDWHERHRGQALYAGTFNRGAAFAMQATLSLEASRLSEIEQISTTALAQKHQLASLADRVAALFIPSILLISAATGLAWFALGDDRALSATLAVLIVSCPCALSLATPAALSAAMARLRELGILTKSSRALEVAQNVGSVVFDKTGTLASPTTRIDSVLTLSQQPTAWCASAASALQLHSSHPLASAFDKAPGSVAHDVVSVPGAGIAGTVDNHYVRIGSAAFCSMQEHEQAAKGKYVYLSIDDTPGAVFELTEQPRADAAAAISALRARGLTLELLSGDLAGNCQRIAEPLQLHYLAAQKPEQKFERMQALRVDAHRANHALMYVGDGMNDLPALAAADLSVATLETNELVKSKADVVLLTQRLGALVDLLNMGRRSQAIIRQNLSWAILYNAIAVPWAVTGTLPPWVAALGMSVSSLIVLANSSRLLRLESASTGTTAHTNTGTSTSTSTNTNSTAGRCA